MELCALVWKSYEMLEYIVITGESTEGKKPVSNVSSVFRLFHMLCLLLTTDNVNY